MLRASALLASFALLAACSGGESASSSDPTAGLNAEILKWRDQIEATHPVCQTKIDGKGCQSFEVTCKALQDLTAEDTAKGVTTKVVSAIRFAARTEDNTGGKPGSAFAVFSKANGAWTRTESKPVNLATCAPL